MVVNSSLVAVSLWICSSSSLYSLIHWLTCSEIAAIVLILLLCSSLEIFFVVPTLIPKIKDKAAAIVLFLFSLTAVTIFSLITSFLLLYHKTSFNFSIKGISAGANLKFSTSDILIHFASSWTLSFISPEITVAKYAISFTVTLGYS